MFTLMFITVGFIVWASNRGFDITDEGFYLLGGRFPAEVKMSTSMAHYYISILYCISCQNVRTLRLIGLILTGVSAIVFYLGFRSLMVRLKMELLQNILFTFVAIPLVCLGAMLGYAWFLPTPSYNSLNATALTIYSGLMFLVLASLDRLNMPRSIVNLASFSAGLCIGISIFVKFPTGISLLVLFGFVLAVWPRQNLKTRLQTFGLLALGLTTWLLVHFIFIQSPMASWQTFYAGMERTKTLETGRHGVGALERYFLECRDLAKLAFLDFWKLHAALVVGFTGLFGLTKAWRDIVWLGSILIFVIFVCAGYLSYHRGFYLGGHTYIVNIARFYLSWLLLLANATLMALIYFQRIHYLFARYNVLELVLFIAVMFSLPFIGAVGTGNPIYINTVYQMAPWFGLLVILLSTLSWLLKHRWILSLGGLILASFACAQIVLGSLSIPYRLNTGLLGQTQITRIGAPTSILKLDPATSEFFNKIHAMAEVHGFRPGDDVLAFVNMPGVVFAIGGKSPAIPWYSGGYKGSPAANEMALSMISPDRLKRAFILETADSEKFMPNLTKFGMSFPNNYILCGEAIWPFTKVLVRLWKPLSS